MKSIFALLFFISASFESRAFADSELSKDFFETKDRFEQLQFIERLTIRNISDDSDENSNEELIAQTAKVAELAIVVD